MTLLKVDQLSASFASEKGARIGVLDGVSFTLERGEALGLVGESGCGKSMTALSIMGLLPRPAGQVDAGRVWFDERDLLQLNGAQMRSIRGRAIAMIFQEPMTALNPVQKIGRQLQEPFALHRPGMGRRERRERCLNLLAEVGIQAPHKRLEEYPHQLSGGMRQRVMIAMALALEPALLIADEPTTALDVTIQAQILDLIDRLRERHGTAVIFITHDLGVVASTCDRVAVMYAGRVVEEAGIEDFFRRPRHPYSRGLMAAIPRLDGRPRVPLQAIAGNVPALEQLGAGCRFADRCSRADSACRARRPTLDAVEGGHRVACLHWREAG